MNVIDLSNLYSLSLDDLLKGDDKMIEHLEENIESLAEIFETNDVFSVEEMLITLMN